MDASSDEDRAGRASPEPASSLGHSATIPCAAQVSDALRWLGGRTSAVALCTILEIRGFERGRAQLGMQRAMDAGAIYTHDDWTLSVSDTHPAGGDREH